MPPAASPLRASPPTGRADDAFAPPAGGWVRVSHRLCWFRRLTVFTASLPAMVLLTFLAADWWGLLGGGLAIAMVLGGCVLGWAMSELNYRSWGFAERDDDLLVTHGVVFRQLVVVPYGRMQLVDVTATFVEQWFGIATVRLYTAAATTDARIPGLRARDAERLRDRLAEKGEARSAGL